MDMEAELECLQSMYTSSELSLRSPTCCVIKVKPRVGDSGTRAVFISCDLVIDWTDSDPRVSIEQPRGLSEAAERKLLETAEQFLEDSITEMVEEVASAVTDLNEVGGGLDCPICMTAMDGGPVFRTSGCMHPHHLECIQQYWFGSREEPSWTGESSVMWRCAVCRVIASRDDVVEAVPDWALGCMQAIRDRLDQDRGKEEEQAEEEIFEGARILCFKSSTGGPMLEWHNDHVQALQEAGAVDILHYSKSRRVVAEFGTPKEAFAVIQSWRNRPVGGDNPDEKVMCTYQM
mmetsp:Transcript_285/g.562  ORF Transcript_285/g.562 Transcript_285/m.562 type:complete len:290 (-) Transcript_285:84-953(-)